MESNFPFAYLRQQHRAAVLCGGRRKLALLTLPQYVLVLLLPPLPLRWQRGLPPPPLFRLLLLLLLLLLTVHATPHKSRQPSTPQKSPQPPPPLPPPTLPPPTLPLPRELQLLPRLRPPLVSLPLPPLQLPCSLWWQSGLPSLQLFLLLMSLTAQQQPPTPHKFPQPQPLSTLVMSACTLARSASTLARSPSIRVRSGTL